MGKPDVVFRNGRIAVFIDSVFWHGNREKFIMPKTNVKYWEKKISRNIERDREVNIALENDNWLVLRFWASDIKKLLHDIVDEIINNLNYRRINNSGHITSSSS